MVGIISKILTGIGVLAIIVVLVLAYLGFVPVLSGIFGTDRPRDLGVRFTQEDLNSVYERAGTTYHTLAPGNSAKDSLRYEGKKEVNSTFTQEQLTARLSDMKWKYNPISDAQVRVNDDGTVEFSGRADTSLVGSCFEAYGIEQDRVNLLRDKAGFMQKPPLYAKGTLTVENGKVSMDLQDLEIGRLPVPADQIPKDDLDGITQEILGNVPGLSIKSLGFGRGGMSFDGSVPTDIYQEPPSP